MTEWMVALGQLMSPEALLPIAVGVLSGIIIGALPGLSVTMGVAVLFPLTFLFEGNGGILMLLGIYVGAVYGGSISAILLNTPGTPASAVTAIEGHPLARRGEGDRALTLSTVASFVGGVFSALVLTFLAPVLSKVALSFSAPEYFALAAFGLSMITAVSSHNLVKGLIGAAVGLLIAMVGIDSFSGAERFTFGSIYLMGGISFVPLLIGLFAFSQLLVSLGLGRPEQSLEAPKVSLKRTLSHIADIWPFRWSVLRSSAIGTFIGSIPGAGGDVAAFVSYGAAKRTARAGETFGDGNMRALASCESANNAVTGGAMVPLLTLGIPGDSVAAIILGAFMVQGLQPGPLLFRDHATDVYMIFGGLLVVNFLMLVFGLLGVQFFTRIARIRKRYLNPTIMILCLIGAYSINNNMSDVYLMVGAGFVGYYLIRHDYGVAPIILGIILGPLLENNLRRALVLSDGDFGIFLERPIALTFLALTALSLFLPLLRKAWNRGRA